MKKQALFWGAGWGLAEATLGHILHMLRVPGLAGFVMIPVGLFMMSRAFKDGGRADTVFLTSVVAAGLKFLDFLVPSAEVLAVIRPAMAILTEGIAVSALYAAASAIPGILSGSRAAEHTVGMSGRSR